VPGRPTITVAAETFPVAWLPPASNGGSPILLYRVYIDGVLAETITAPDTATVDSVLGGSVVEVSAVNAIGEGPKSAPVIATA
jgi:hypothetical protein